METHKVYKNGDRLLCFPCAVIESINNDVKITIVEFKKNNYPRCDRCGKLLI